MRRLAWLFSLLLAVSAPAAAEAKRVRVFAVGPKFSVDWLQTRETWRAKMFALVDREKRGPGSPAVAAGADDVASHRTGSDLVTLPEDLGLTAAFVGSRGAAGRMTPASDAAAVQAVAALLGPYAPQTAYYQDKYPKLRERALPTRALGLALTDTFIRTALETYSELAREYGVWLAAGAPLAADFQVVCESRATFVPTALAPRCDVENAARVLALRDPDEPTRNYAYEATSPDVVNYALVFDPRGRLVSRQPKTYLVPLEQPSSLDFVPGRVSGGLSAVPTAVGTLGFVTSKDAWMPDVTAKLDAAGVDLLVQPEFFEGDWLKTTGTWGPDTLKASGWADVLRYPSMEAMVLPELTGNFFSFTADAQQHIVVKPRGRNVPRGALAGQEPGFGLKAVQPYAIADPGGSIAERRAALGRGGEAMRPGGPACPSPATVGACAGGQQEGVLWSDVEVARRPVYRRTRTRRKGPNPFAASRPLAPSRAAQRNVDVAARGARVVAVWEQRVRGTWRVQAASSADGGRRWSKPVRVSRGGRDEWWPSVSIGPDGRTWVAWQTGTSPRVFVAGARRGLRFSRPRAVGGPAAAQWRPAIAATRRGQAFAVWIDERDRSADDDLPQARVYGARLGTAGRVEAARRLDQGEPVELAARLDHSWAPDLAARGRRLVLSWVDFRTYDWRPYYRLSADGGASWGDERSLASTPADVEALDDTPRAAYGAGGPLVAWTDFRKDPESFRRIQGTYTIRAAKAGSGGAGPDRRVDRGPIQAGAFSPAVVPAGRGYLAAWQSHAAGPGRIELARLSGTGRAGRVRRVDDAGSRGTNAWRPAMAVAGGRALVAWEDERDGPRQVYVTGAALRRLR